MATFSCKSNKRWKKNKLAHNFSYLQKILLTITSKKYSAHIMVHLLTKFQLDWM